MSGIGAKIFPARPPGSEFVHDLNSWTSATFSNKPFNLPVNPEMYRRKIWFAVGSNAVADANFMIDSVLRFSYKGERIFELPFQYNSRSASAVGSPCDVYLSANFTIVNPSDYVLHDEPLFASGAGITALGATPFRGTFVCDRVEWIASRYLITGAEKVFAFLAVHSEYPY